MAANLNVASSENTGLPPEDDGEVSGDELLSDDEFFIRGALLKDDRLGLELLYSRYYQALCNHAARFVGSRQVAEDIVSEIFFRFYSKRIFERVTTSYRAYLFRTVRNYGYNYLRWEATRKAPLEDGLELPETEARQPDRITQFEELYQDVERIVSDLPIQCRNIYTQFHFEGKSHREIALQMGISIRTVEAHIYRAKQRVCGFLKEKWFISLLLMLLI